MGFIIFASISLEEFSNEQGMSQWISGGIAYVFITLMALTSNDKMVKKLGFKKWKKLHLVGSYIIFFVFATSYLKHTLKNPEFYLPLLIISISSLVIRIIAHLYKK